MTNEELRLDLDNKFDQEGYFKEKLFIKDSVYKRRTFSDLFKYYKWEKVSEQQLMTVLKDMQIRAFRCPDIGQIVFHKSRYVRKLSFEMNGSLSVRNPVTNSKYTYEYLLKLYDQK